MSDRTRHNPSDRDDYHRRDGPREDRRIRSDRSSHHRYEPYSRASHRDHSDSERRRDHYHQGRKRSSEYNDDDDDGDDRQRRESSRGRRRRRSPPTRDYNRKQELVQERTSRAQGRHHQQRHRTAGEREEQRKIPQLKEGMDDAEMMKMMGLPVDFDTTRGKEVSDKLTHMSGANVIKQRKYRQYMNRNRKGADKMLDADIGG